MNTKKLTKICAMLLSFSMIFSSMQPLSAFATQGINDADNALIQSLSATETPTQPPNEVTPTPTIEVSPSTSPEISPTPLPVNGASLQKTIVDGEETQEEIEAALSSSKEESARGTKEGRAAVPQAFAAASGMDRTLGNTIDPGDLSGWYKYDNYYHQSGTSAASQNHNTQGGKHPYFWYDDPTVSNKNLVYTDIASINSNVLSAVYPNTAHFSKHIWVEGSGSNAEITFLGYGTTGYTDFLLYPTTRVDVKTVGFDINAANVKAHTVSEFGFLVNAAIENNTITGYLVRFLVVTPKTGKLYVDRINMNVNDFHNGSRPGHSNFVSDYTIGSTGVMRVEMDILPNSIALKQKNYLANGNLDTQASIDKTVTLVGTGHNGFGPMVGYSGHYCSELSSVKFGKILMTVNYSVIFDKNANDAVASNPTRIDDIVPGSTIKLPAPPTRPGFTFMGWYTNKDNTGTLFTENMPITATTVLYAYWAPAAAPTITFNPAVNGPWTNQNVKVKYDVKLVDNYNDIAKSEHDKDGAGFVSSATIAVDKKSASDEVEFTKNGKLTVKTSSTYPNSFLQSIQSYTVGNIDKTAPTIGGTKPTGMVTDASFNAVTFADSGDPGEAASQVKQDTRTLYLFKTDGSLYKTILFSDLAAKLKEVAPGKYTYTISVRDNAGNYVDSNGKTDTTTPPTTIVTPPTNGGREEIIINASKVVITPETHSKVWTNKDINVKYDVKSTDKTGIAFVNESGDITNSYLDPGDPYFGELVFTKNGSVKLESSSNVGIQADQKTVNVTNIDKTPPKISNLPSKQTIITAEILSKVVFEDFGDSNGEISDESGIRDGSYNRLSDSRVLYLLNDNGIDPVIEIPWSKAIDKAYMSSKNNVPSGQYSYIIAVRDNAGNYVDSNGHVFTTFGPEEIIQPQIDVEEEELNEHTVIINAEKPILVINDYVGGWKNTDIEVKYTFTPDGTDFKKITEIGKFNNETNNVFEKLPSGKYEGTLIFTKNGEIDIYGITKANLDETGTAKIDKIDKTFPKIDLESLPKANEIVVSTDFDKITYEDFGDNGQTDTKSASQIDDSKTVVVLYDQNDKTAKPIVVGKDGNGKFAFPPAMPEGEYKYDVYVVDNAGNAVDSNGKTYPGGIPTTPPATGGESGPAIIGATAPTITPKTASITNWTNKDVTVGYDVTGKITLTSVKEDSTEKTPAGLTYAGSLTFTQNGKVDLNATNLAKLAAIQKTVTVGNIDKTVPKIAIDSTIVKENEQLTQQNVTNGITFTDPDTNPNNISDMSGISVDVAGAANSESRMLYLYKEGATTPTYSILWTGLSALSDAQKVPEGSYKFVVSARDIAGNYVNSIGGSWNGTGKEPDKFPSGTTDPDGKNIDGKDKGPDITGSTTIPDIIIGTGSIALAATEPIKWTNRDVSIPVAIKSSVAINKITVDGKTVAINPANPKDQAITLVFADNGHQVVAAGNVVKKDATATYTVNYIDKIAPKITIPATGTLDATIFADPIVPSLAGNKGLGGLEASGLDPTTVTLKAELLNATGGVVNTAPLIASGANAFKDLKLVSGKSYRLTVNGSDNAGNAAVQTVGNYSAGGGTASTPGATAKFTELTDLSTDTTKWFNLTLGSESGVVNFVITKSDGTVSSTSPPTSKTQAQNTTARYSITLAAGDIATVTVTLSGGGTENYVVKGAAETTGNVVLLSGNFKYGANYKSFAVAYNKISVSGANAPFTKSIVVYSDNTSSAKETTVTAAQLNTSHSSGTLFKVVIKDNNGNDVLFIGEDQSGASASSVAFFQKK